LHPDRIVVVRVGGRAPTRETRTNKEVRQPEKSTFSSVLQNKRHENAVIYLSDKDSPDIKKEESA
jgi:hypothetical protein